MIHSIRKMARKDHVIKINISSIIIIISLACIHFNQPGAPPKVHRLALSLVHMQRLPEVNCGKNYQFYNSDTVQNLS